MMMLMKKRSGIGLVRMAVLAVGCVLILIGVLGTIRRMNRDFSAQLSQSLQDVSSQNALALRNQLDNSSTLLSSLEAMLRRTDQGIETDMTYMTPFVKRYGLKRLGYCTPDGMTHSTDGVVVDLSGREFFQQGMQGLNCISDVLVDAMATSGREELVTVMSKPIISETGEVTGVFCLTYDARSMSQSLQSSCFDGRGVSFAVDLHGDVMVEDGRQTVLMRENFFTQLTALHQDNAAEAARLQEAMAQEKPFMGILRMP